MRPAAAPGRVADWWPAWLRGWRADAVIAFVAGAIQLVGTYFAARSQTDRASMDAFAYALLAAGPAAPPRPRGLPLAPPPAGLPPPPAAWATRAPPGAGLLGPLSAGLTP